MLVRKLGAPGGGIGWGRRDSSRQCIDVFANPTRTTGGLYWVHASNEGYVATLDLDNKQPFPDQPVQFGNPGSFAGDRGA